MKVLLGGVAAFVAGIGGAMLALSLGVALAGNYETLLGVVWLTVLVTLGIRFNATALAAGLSQTLVAGLVLVFLPKIFSNFVPIFFGLGAIALIQFPQGVLTFQVRLFKGAVEELRERTPRLYGRLRLATLAYIVAFVVVVFTVRNLWWLWLAITFFGYNVAYAYLFRRSQQRLKGLAKEIVEPERPAGDLEVIPAAQTDAMAPSGKTVSPGDRAQELRCPGVKPLRDAAVDLELDDLVFGLAQFPQEVIGLFGELRRPRQNRRLLVELDRAGHQTPFVPLEIGHRKDVAVGLHLRVGSDLERTLDGRPLALHRLEVLSPVGVGLAAMASAT